MNIVLTGLSGSGKSTLSRAVAERLGKTAVDTDALIEEHEGRPIRRIFDEKGEAYFRDVESRMVCRAAEMRDVVIATGGGAVLREENIRALQKSGLILFLDRDPDKIVKDIECSNRPLLADGAEKLYRLSEERRPVYRATADIVFPNNGAEGEAVEELVRTVKVHLDQGYAVIGDPIGHSLSPAIHQIVFETVGHRGGYIARQVQKGEIGEFVSRAREQGLRGFNITAPNKQDVIPLLDEVDEEARLCGAVNTVVARNGRLCGYNTDMEGLLLSVRDQGHDYRDSRITVLGTGGAAAGVVFKAAREGAKLVTVLGRRPDAAEELCRRIREIVPGAPVQSGDMGPEGLGRGAVCDVLINTVPPATPLAALPVVKELPGHALVYDMAYSPPRTELLQRAETRGLKVCNGLGMLIYQALLADELYLDRRLEKQKLYEGVKDALSLQKKVRTEA